MSVCAECAISEFVIQRNRLKCPKFRDVNRLLDDKDPAIPDDMVWCLYAKLAKLTEGYVPLGTHYSDKNLEAPKSRALQIIPASQAKKK